jgi:hypothetical protein
MASDLYAQPFIDVSDSPEILRLAEEVSRTGQRRVIGRDGQALAVIIPAVGDSPSDDLWAAYSASAVQAVIGELAGVLDAADADAMLDELYRAREEGSRPDNRP